MFWRDVADLGLRFSDGAAADYFFGANIALMPPLGVRSLTIEPCDVEFEDKFSVFRGRLGHFNYSDEMGRPELF
jgi:hypothetical protein